ncbi:MAG: (2Fe-2S)-binding protein [Pseudomonadota bacterium]
MFRQLRPPSERVTVFIDGVRCEADADESVAAVLARQPEFWSRKTAVSGEKRAPYCMMGVCFECLATVDGVASVQTCLTRAKDGMRVERQVGPRRAGL